MGNRKITAIAIIQPDIEEEKYKFVGRIHLDPIEVDYFGNRAKVEDILYSIKTRMQNEFHPTATDMGGTDTDQTYSTEEYIRGLNRSFTRHLRKVDAPMAFADRGQSDIIEAFKEEHNAYRFE